MGDEQIIINPRDHQRTTSPLPTSYERRRGRRGRRRRRQKPITSPRLCLLLLPHHHHHLLLPPASHRKRCMQPLPPPLVHPLTVRAAITQAVQGKAKPVPKEARQQLASSVVTLQQLLRVKLRPTSMAPKGRAHTMEYESDSSLMMACSHHTKSPRGALVTLADITNVQLRQAPSQRPPSTLSQGSHGKGAVAAPFKLRRVEGIERSPGGTPIRPDFAKSSQNNTTDNFAIALKKKFEVSAPTL